MRADYGAIAVVMSAWTSAKLSARLWSLIVDLALEELRPYAVATKPERCC
jgi:hypothetical protein